LPQPKRNYENKTKKSQKEPAAEKASIALLLVQTTFPGEPTHPRPFQAPQSRWFECLGKPALGLLSL
jgi:hypothetical protein